MESETIFTPLASALAVWYSVFCQKPLEYTTLCISMHEEKFYQLHAETMAITNGGKIRLIKFLKVSSFSQYKDSAVKSV